MNLRGVQGNIASSRTVSIIYDIIWIVFMVETYLVLELNRRQKNPVMSKVSAVSNSVFHQDFLSWFSLDVISISAKRYVSGLSVGPSTKALVQG